MTRTRCGKTLLELLVIVVVLLGLGGMLAHAALKVRTATRAAQAPTEFRDADVSVSLNDPGHVPAP
jgi:hypothetical protein